MKKILFENEYYRSEKINGDTVITVLRDVNNFFGIDTTGSKIITTSRGVIDDLPTLRVWNGIKRVCEQGDSHLEMWYKIRNRTLNHLISMI